MLPDPLIDNYIARVTTENKHTKIGITIGFLVNRNKYDSLAHPIKSNIEKTKNRLYMSDITYYELIKIIKAPTDNSPHNCDYCKLLEKEK